VTLWARGDGRLGVSRGRKKGLPEKVTRAEGAFSKRDSRNLEPPNELGDWIPSMHMPVWAVPIGVVLLLVGLQVLVRRWK
jgi:hypothetical protein